VDYSGIKLEQSSSPLQGNRLDHSCPLRSILLLGKMSVEFDVAVFCCNLLTPSGVLAITPQLCVETSVYFCARVARRDVQYGS
jgi:hypothetical protein